MWIAAAISTSILLGMKAGWISGVTLSPGTVAINHPIAVAPPPIKLR
jgi:hypothetical protein